MSSPSCHAEEAKNQIRYRSVSSTASDDEDFVDDDEDNNDYLNTQSTDSNNKCPANRTKSKKTQGRVKINMAYIDNKVRRYTTFSKRKTGIMKKAYELATLTGTEVMLLVASETGEIDSFKNKHVVLLFLGHVYTYATPKLQPMITSEAGKALIQTCLAKDEPVAEHRTDTLTSTPSAQSSTTTTLNSNDVIIIDENQRKKRTATSTDAHCVRSIDSNRPLKRAKLKPSSELLSSSSSLDKSHPMDGLNSNSYSVPLPSTTSTIPVSCLIPSDPEQNHASIPVSYTIDLNTSKANGTNIVFTPLLMNSPEQTLIPSNNPFVFTLGNVSYQSS